MIDYREETETTIRRMMLLLLFAALVVTFIPWLGMTSFNTKGEPREAIVAMSMMQSGNYVLPVSMGADIPYKPPFLAWLIVGASYLTGGLNEFASRLPSAVAAIAMVMGVAAFYMRRGGWTAGLLAALVTATNVEVWRAASACRVDMVLTACMVGAMLVMESGYRRRGRVTVSPWAVLLMTGAALTKGPVGVALPCLVMLVYVMLRGERFLPNFMRLCGLGILSLIVPALWYVAAYNSGGGETFVNLALEENIGRLTGRMSYESHVNPFYYNFLTLFAGMAPYTLVAVMALFVIRWRKIGLAPVKGIARRVREMEPTRLFSLTVIVVIFVFYCIPASKRSVYLLPIYPFVSYFAGQLLCWLGTRHRRVVNIYGTVIAVVGVLLFLFLLFGSRSLAGSYLPARAAATAGGILESVSGTWRSVFLILPAATAIEIFRSFRKSGWMATVFTTMVTTFTIYWATSAAILPSILNEKSDRPVAEVVEQTVPAGEPVYQYISDPLLRYYTIGFYTGDRLRLFEGPADGASATIGQPSREVPRQGWLLVGVKDFEELGSRHSNLDMKVVYRQDRRSCDRRDTTLLVRFTPRLQEARF